MARSPRWPTIDQEKKKFSRSASILFFSRRYNYSAARRQQLIWQQLIWGNKNLFAQAFRRNHIRLLAIGQFLQFVNMPAHIAILIANY
ncbi:hypothetical protein D5R40_20130 [Okeania hirsuta]|uniref:Uncharacterized protein n=1 Tax=Okeania hirsuta TaxID=1458930 RepID=A0A3N6RC53_9CYAN|nr:hypothetical protein D5R40_20130 [Okeania hirsuta]